MTKQYELLVINKLSGISSTVDVYDIEDFENEEIEEPGICLFLDGRGDLVEVLESGTDIIGDAYETSLNSNYYFYALLVGGDEPFSYEEVYSFFNTIRQNIIDFTTIDLPLSLKITISQN